MPCTHWELHPRSRRKGVVKLYAHSQIDWRYILKLLRRMVTGPAFCVNWKIGAGPSRQVTKQSLVLIMNFLWSIKYWFGVVYAFKNVCRTNCYSMKVWNLGGFKAGRGWSIALKVSISRFVVCIWKTIWLYFCRKLLMTCVNLAKISNWRQQYRLYKVQTHLGKIWLS